MFDPLTERWPPVYDADELASTIKDLLASCRLETSFYTPTRGQAEICQGDIVALPADVPVIDEDGLPSMYEAKPPFWLVIGNTCDFARPVSTVAWTQMVPIFDVAQWDTLPPPKVEAIKRYELYRQFYVPPWDNDTSSTCLLAELPMPVTVHKVALAQHARVCARMSVHGWVLLHACLVRFLARDDGRHAED